MPIVTVFDCFLYFQNDIPAALAPYLHIVPTLQNGLYGLDDLRVHICALKKLKKFYSLRFYAPYITLEGL